MLEAGLQLSKEIQNCKARRTPGLKRVKKVRKVDTLRVKDPRI